MKTVMQLATSVAAVQAIDTKPLDQAAAQAPRCLLPGALREALDNLDVIVAKCHRVTTSL